MIKDIVNEDFNLFCSKLFINKNGKFNLNDLKSWFNPISFYPNSTILHQPQAGPCGLYASLQAYIELIKNRDSVFDPIFLLYSSILQIQQIIGSGFNFCIEISSNKFKIYQTQDYDEALCYLLEKSLFLEEKGCLLLTISFIYCSFHQDWFSSVSTPFIDQNGNTQMILVFLLLLGNFSNETIDKIESKEYDFKQQDIGLVIIHNELGGKNFNENSNIFVTYKNFHFFVIIKEYDQTFRIVDNLFSNNINKIINI